MIQLVNIPEDRTELHPWFAGLLKKDAKAVSLSIQQRISMDASLELVPLIDHVAEFVPHRLRCLDGTGFVHCIKQTSQGKPEFRSTEFLIIAQPLPDDVLRSRVNYFEETLRPLIREFLSKFAGCGENIEFERAGQFVICADIAKNVAYYEPEKLGGGMERYAAVICSCEGRFGVHKQERRDCLACP
jgi:hypothetical protein